MKIVFTKHAIEKFPILTKLGWKLSKKDIERTIKNPAWKGISRFGQQTAMTLLDENHIIRVIYNIKDGIIKVITFHIARRGKYESTLQ